MYSIFKHYIVRSVVTFLRRTILKYRWQLLWTLPIHHTPGSPSASACCCLRLSAARSSKAALSSCVFGFLLPRDSSPPERELPPRDRPPVVGKEGVVEAAGSDGARTGAGPPPLLPPSFPPLPVSQAFGPLAMPRVMNPTRFTKPPKHPP
mmetsp:Transcript_20436/g.44282  ORF Transcript_20436/g.44282 Transcript_20436/m.44282 type:complete len:150 (+) Transcript_20436:395-844(+)